VIGVWKFGSTTRMLLLDGDGGCRNCSGELVG
jgi:hypothetical protein